MVDLIDRAALLETLMPYVQNRSGDIFDAIDAIKAIHAVDAVILPCKLGNTVYEVHRWKDGSGFIVESKMVGLHLFDEKSRRNLPRKEYMVLRCNGYSKHVDLDKLGKIVFLSREEAEAVLR